MQNSSKQIQDSANFGVILLQKSTEMTKNKGETTKYTEIKDEIFKPLQNKYNFEAKILSF